MFVAHYHKVQEDLCGLGGGSAGSLESWENAGDQTSTAGQSDTFAGSPKRRTTSRHAYFLMF